MGASGDGGRRVHANDPVAQAHALERSKETWTGYNARVAVGLVHAADWDGILLDRSDPDESQRLQDQVRAEVGLSASLGVATNKLVAKVASEQDKPGGLTVVRPGRRPPSWSRCRCGCCGAWGR